MWRKFETLMSPMKVALNSNSANRNGWKHHDKAGEAICCIWSDDWRKSTPSITRIAGTGIGAVADSASHQPSSTDSRSMTSICRRAGKCKAAHAIAPLTHRLRYPSAYTAVDQLLQIAGVVGLILKLWNCWHKKCQSQQELDGVPGHEICATWKVSWARCCVASLGHIRPPKPCTPNGHLMYIIYICTCANTCYIYIYTCIYI